MHDLYREYVIADHVRNIKGILMSQWLGTWKVYAFMIAVLIDIILVHLFIFFTFSFIIFDE
jgi:hypothetical protein